MAFLVYLSSMIIPMTFFFIIMTALIKKTPLYDNFVEGATEGLKTIIAIMPTLIGLMVAVGVLRNSGFLNFLSQLIGPLSRLIHFPKELVPLAIVRLFSSSAATGLALDIFKEYGTDSRLGLIASVMMSCTETVFYTMSVYYMSVKISKTRWTLAGALICTLGGLIASIVIC